MNVLIVESPSKAKSINKYLGSDFKVLASVGHVRDLSAKNAAIDTENNFAMKWEPSDSGIKVIKEVATNNLWVIFTHSEGNDFFMTLSKSLHFILLQSLFYTIMIVLPKGGTRSRRMTKFTKYTILSNFRHSCRSCPRGDMQAVTSVRTRFSICST